VENLYVVKMEKEMIDRCAALFMDTFSKEPWNDAYDSVEQVVRFFNGHLANNYFAGYVAMLQNQMIALCLGMKKPWVKGMEYYIDEFCVRSDLQGTGIGSRFLKEIEKDIREQGMDGMILNTQNGFPSRKFYEKNGFHEIQGLSVFARRVADH